MLQVDWKVAMKGPKLSRDSFRGQMGLSSLLSMAENSDAYSAAAQTALAAARITGYRNSDDAETGAAKPLLYHCMATKPSSDIPTLARTGCLTAAPMCMSRWTPQSGRSI